MAYVSKILFDIVCTKKLKDAVISVKIAGCEHSKLRRTEYVNNQLVILETSISTCNRFD